MPPAHRQVSFRPISVGKPIQYKGVTMRSVAVVSERESRTLEWHGRQVDGQSVIGWWSVCGPQCGVLARQPPLRGPAVGHGISSADPSHDTGPGGEGQG